MIYRKQIIKSDLSELLNVAAAFDTYHHILLQFLHDRFGICGNVIICAKEYVTGNQQKVAITDSLGNTTFSDIIILGQGILQGRMLGLVYPHLVTFAEHMCLTSIFDADEQICVIYLQHHHIHFIKHACQISIILFQTWEAR